ncbi:MAG: MerR family transcriptional regulator [Lachnospiraceae bacterium]|nr:MerR family transcriptional regulator [Lachnospiraceae bacterium]
MSKYTTGEMAKLCGVTVRTVQYYDSRGILVPSGLSEGGRRLYSEEDLHKLRIICFLRNMDLPIHAIGELFQEKDPGSVITTMLEEQSRVLEEEIRGRQGQLEQVEALRRELRGVEHFSVESLGDIAYHMENKRKLRQVRIRAVLVGIVADILEWGSLICGILTGIWWPFFIGITLAVILCVGIFQYYTGRTAYICPQCHTVFKPPLKENFWARHTPTARKLTCLHCGHHGYCVETYKREEMGDGASEMQSKHART